MSNEAEAPISGVITVSTEPLWHPTGRLRWAIPSAAAYSAQPSCARLQQEWIHMQLNAVRRTEWRDVPIEAAP